MVEDWLLEPHSGFPLIPNWVFINSEIKTDELWMLFFDCEDPFLPACVGIRPKSSLTQNRVHPYKHREIWALGKCYEHKGAQHTEVMFRGVKSTMYVCWVGSSSSHVCFTAQNNAACSHFQGFGLPATFLHMYTPLSHRAVCLGGSFLAPASLGRAVMPTLKVIKKRETGTFSSLKFSWKG